MGEYMICDLTEALSLGGWGMTGHRVVHYKAVVFLYHPSYTFHIMYTTNP